MPLIWLLACASDNAVKDHRPNVFDSGTLETGTPPEEACNGEDDDGDALVDEDFPDEDGNGRADCLDQECPALDVPEAGPVPRSDACDSALPDDQVVDEPQAMTTKWTFSTPPAPFGYAGSYAMPAVANLDDDNGDGRIDEADSPEVLVLSAVGVLHVVDGVTGAERWNVAGLEGAASVVVGDVDADGAPDIVTAADDHHVVALLADGSPKWEAGYPAEEGSYITPILADLDGDGQPEVINDAQVLDGADGRLLFELEVTPGEVPYRLPAVADVDQDGDQEIAFDGKLFDSDGTLLWESGIPAWYGLFPVVIQADTDPEAELAFVGDGLGLFEHDGTPIFTTTFTTGHGYVGVPCAADFDGDGEAELAFPHQDALSVYDLDGEELWRDGTQDVSGLSGCSGWDLDNDGAMELLYAGEITFEVRDGATGELWNIDTTHESSTLYDYPTVADLDGDGHGEILVAQNAGSSDVALTVYEHPYGGWALAGRTWPVHDFAVTNARDDHTIPAAPEASWLAENVYRARTTRVYSARPDLAVTLTDQCVADCVYGPVSVGISVENVGDVDVAAGQLLSLYAVDDSGDHLVASVTLPEVPASTRLAPITLDVDPADLGDGGWRVAVDEGELLAECDEDNNVALWTEASCP